MLNGPDGGAHWTLDTFLLEGEELETGTDAIGPGTAIAYSEVPLSTGAHTLSYAAADRTAAAVTATVNVTVGAILAGDLKLAALYFQRPARTGCRGPPPPRSA